MLVRSVRYINNLELTFLTQNFYPTIYALNDPHPIAICNSTVSPDGTSIPDGERTYVNACTIKVSSPSFGLGSHVHRAVAWVFWGTIPHLGFLLRRGF
jgi:hypothetical protein